MSEAQYPEDEFDRIGKRLPRGAHRPGQPWWYGFLPFVIAIIAAPLLAWALLLLLGSHPASTNTGAEPSNPAPTTSDTARPNESVGPGETVAGNENSVGTGDTATPSETATSPSATASPAETPAADKVDKATSVSVLNASGINGLAAKTKDKIAAKGYSQVVAENFTGTKPKQNTIYYPAASEAEAKEIQQVLGIDMIVPREDVTGVRVVLVGSL
ncbi:LytR C-terminal domain-containing protein [Mobiluncus porci]|uniref:LytR/CpsA/Psr regulator C-terminal domain-containing protein n=1 Tax=Mobiluncus porci TaxID=2652278 RepID=A0A7K0K2I0_9ACTO|nr:hypothetical protein [Mobiluncus porci]